VESDIGSLDIDHAVFPRPCPEKSDSFGRACAAIAARSGRICKFNGAIDQGVLDKCWVPNSDIVLSAEEEIESHRVACTPWNSAKDQAMLVRFCRAKSRHSRMAAEEVAVKRGRCQTVRADIAQAVFDRSCARTCENFASSESVRIDDAAIDAIKGESCKQQTDIDHAVLDRSWRCNSEMGFRAADDRE